MKFFTKQKKPGWFVLSDSGSGSSVAYVIKNHNEKPIVMFAEMRPESLKDSAAVEVLVKDLGLSNQHCSLLLAQGEYQLLQLEKPNVPASELKQAVGWKLKDMIECPVEQATVDVIDIPTDPNNSRRQPYVYAVAAKNTLISEYIQRLIETSNSGLEVIDIPELAQRNIATFIEQEGRGLAMLSINDSGCLLTFTANGELYYSRYIDVDTSLIESEDSVIKSSTFERLSLDVQRSLDSFERQFPYITINRLVLAPFMGREDFYDYLKTSLYIQVDQFNLDDIFSFDDGVDLGNLSNQANFLPLLGAALRQDESA
ncbi:MAG: agglutinin biogenesis protein MshI [Methylotenera sp.]|nr:agglutinin biogenesis protein MshI [Methylotenera sp.]